MTRISVATIALFAFLQAAVPPPQEYAPVACAGPLPYNGPPLYDTKFKPPSSAFALGTKPFDAGTISRLDLAVNEAMESTKATAMTAAIATRNGAWSTMRGGGVFSAPKRLYWASVGKAATAAVILQLVDEGKLSLEDKVSKWITAVPNAPVMTIDNLLQHTSGLFSANEDVAVRAEPRLYTPEEHFKIAATHGAMFCPGQKWRYSNTGYSVLGRIIEAVDKRQYHEAVNARIATRVGLTTFRALAPNEAPDDVAPLTPTTDTGPKMMPSWGYAAGNVVASAEDMLNFWKALLDGRLLSAKSMARLYERLYPMFDEGTFYGRGAMLFVVPQPTGAPRIWLGHSGGAPGIKSVVAYSPSDGAFVAVALTSDGSAEATANLLLKRLAGS